MTADVIVLGAGIIGLAIARKLVQSGLTVRVLERRSAAGLGSSGRCDGNVLLQTKDDEILIALTLRGIAIYEQWVNELPYDIRFEQCGSVVFFTDPEQIPAGQERIDHLAALGVPVDYVDGPVLVNLEPNLVNGLPGGLVCPLDAEVYPPTVVAGLIGDALRLGCEIQYDTTALRLLTDRSGRVSGILTSRGRMACPIVINAMGAWSSMFETPRQAPRVPVRPRQGLLLVTEECPGLIRNNLREAQYLTDRSNANDVSDIAKVSFAAEPTYRGNLLVGSSRQFVGYDQSVGASLLTEMVHRAVSFVPALRQVSLIRSFAGLRPWTPDNKPMVGRCANVPGYMMATGHEGEGIGLAPATAELIAAEVLGEAPTALGRRALRHLSPDRFGQLAGADPEPSERV